jgi:hypothetical protein
VSEQVIAQAILRAPDGSSILDEGGELTAANIARYRVGEDVIAEASDRLRELGFEVLQQGPVSLTISGDKALFERVLDTDLQRRETKADEPGIAGVQAAYYEATSPMRIPTELASLVADVALTTPPTFYP